MPFERHTVFYDVWDALGIPDDCPICFLHRRHAHKFMDDLLYENVNNPVLREHLRESLGFCDEGRALAEELHDGQGLSILLASLAHNVALRLRGLKPQLTPERPCPLAESTGEAEARYLRVFVRHYGESDVQKRHEAGFGFCLEHLGVCLSLFEDKDLRLRLCAAEKGKIEHLLAELQLYVDKCCYTNTSPIGGEANAWIRALRKFRRSETA